ncbi:MAG: hypothetical protein PHC43_03970 [Candidatus Marinimicrobia bacterium]|jgi:hypothetical protein|nr:hypothetical protein [Candidatus Neomarinimicrobiota bacterium]MDD5061072.1 hypothetical protein [Candidatus Neomarinimicrobiota bacterium]MDD5230462.1 hypothetical protein [Candidatus Neomarinimicrobiota bacterium]MDD5539555.1 hypothetical protein [Candidatus Neomarinimicrobiota bacterium]
MEDLVCPECNAPLTEEGLKKSLTCPNCKTNLRDSKYLDFLELLVYYDIVDDIDFFDMSLYGEEMLKNEREDYDEPDIDPSKFEKRKEVWDEFEDDIELNENLAEEIDDSEDPWNLSDHDIPFEDDWGDDKDNREQ